MWLYQKFLAIIDVISLVETAKELKVTHHKCFTDLDHFENSRI